MAENDGPGKALNVFCVLCSGTVRADSCFVPGTSAKRSARDSKDRNPFHVGHGFALGNIIRTNLVLYMQSSPECGFPCIHTV